jgi:hypothetical protein
MLPSRRAFNILLGALSAVALLAGAPVSAQPITGTPATVYRVDTRPPSEVFQNGFSSGGILRSLLAHALGSSCDAEIPSQRSAWVSTTASHRQTVQFALEQLSTRTIPQAALNGGSGIWIYAIAPDHTYLHVLSMISRAIVAGGTGQYGFTPIHSAMLTNLVHRSAHLFGEHEVVTRQVVPSNIISAALVTYDPNAPAHQSLDLSRPPVHNPGYQQPATQITNQTNSLEVLIPPLSIALYTAPTNESCYLACDGAWADGASQQERRSLMSSGLQCAGKPNAAQLFIGADE